MRSSTRYCVFCGTTPLTLEHNPPQWINEFCSDLDHGGTTTFFTDRSRTHPRGASHTVAATAGRVVCGRCNNGWMSNLENAVKPVLGPMTQGHGTRLTKERQGVLAEWLIKSSLVHAAVTSWQNTTRFGAAFARFHELRDAILPWFVFVAAHGGKETEYTRQYFASYLEGSSKEQRQFPAYAYAIVIGHFVGAVTYSGDVTFPVPPPPLERIAPARAVFIWPRGRYMTLQDIEVLGTGPSAEEFAGLLR